MATAICPFCFNTQYLLYRSIYSYLKTAAMIKYLMQNMTKLLKLC